jgi:hypothetical protein
LRFPPFTTAVLESSILVFESLKKKRNTVKERRQRERSPFGFSLRRSLGFKLKERERERERDG